MTETIKTYSPEGLAELLKQAGQPSFRVKQLLEWLYVHPVATYDEMTNLPATLRSFLAETAPLTHSTIHQVNTSLDGTKKYLFKLYDGEFVEAVAIPSFGSTDRMTACVSTQVGCSMNCAFCATGQQGLTRNLGAGEIVDQVLAIQKDTGERVSNVVVMGQGEPFLNFDNTMGALHILNDPKGIAIGARKITVSTCGIIPAIKRFAEDPRQFTLAVSLHAARQSVRDQIMPSVSAFTLENLKPALASYIEKTNRRVTFEYLLMAGVNDSQSDLDALINYCDGLLCHINFLPLNSVPQSPLQPSSSQVVNRWIACCKDYGIEATLRTSRGSDIAGACGQLKNTVLS